MTLDGHELLSLLLVMLALGIVNMRPNGLTIYEVNLNDTNGLEINFEGNYSISNTSIDDFTNQWRLERIRESQKQRRIQFIQVQILERLGFQNKPNVTFVVSEDRRKQITRKLEELRVEQDNDLIQNNEEVYAERVQSFYPSCSLPRNTDKEVWDDPNNFHIYYNISSPRQMQGTSINVSSARLRLFKTNDEAEEAKTAVESNNEPEMLNDPSWFDVTGSRILDEKRMRVTVFQYLKPLRRNRRPKKKLLDSKMISLGYNGWIDFNIRPSIRDWFENGNKNFGLEVILEDEHEASQNPSEFIQNMNCSESRDDPMVGDNESALFDNETYPTLDLRTVEFQEEPILSQQQSNETGDQRRHKRQVPCSIQDGSGSCCYDTMFITFQELGMEKWIIEPRGFEMGYCLGSCAPYDAMDASATDQKSAHCVPDRLSSLNLAYVDEDGNTNIGTIDNFLIKSCSCA